MKRCLDCRIEKPLESFYRKTQPGRSGYQSRCKACEAVRVRDRRRANLDHYRRLARVRYWEKGDRELIQERRRDDQESRVERTAALKRETMERYGDGHCSCCGETESTFLTLDHADDDGKRHRELTRSSGKHFYSWLKARGWPNQPRLQVLCFNCNIGRAVAGGVCPHQNNRIMGQK